MDKSVILASLALFTLLAGMLTAYVNLKATSRAIKTGEHTDGSKSRPYA